MNRLSYRWQLALIGLFSTAIMIALISQLVNSSITDIAFAEKEIIGAKYLDPVIQLLRNIQIYRQQDNEYTNSDSHLKEAKIEQLDKIEKNIQIINDNDKKYGETLKTTSQWNQIRNKWLKKNLDDSKKEDFNYYTSLIDQILEFTINVADTSNLTLDPTINTYYLVNTYTIKLPSFIEEVMLIESLGIGALQKKVLTEGELNRILALKIRGEFNKLKIFGNIDKVISDNPLLSINLKNLTVNFIKNATNSIFKLDFLLNKQFDIPLDEFIGEFNSLINEAYLLEKTVGQLLQMLIEERVDSLKKALYISLIFALLVLLSLLYLFIGLANNLSDKESRARAIFESTSDCIVTINLSGKILSFNSRTLETLNCTMEELENGNLHDYILDLSKEQMGKNKLEPTEFTISRKNGDNFSAEISYRKIDLNNTPILVCTIRDISERKKIEKMKKDFISVVSHELRTPLTSIKGAIGLLQGQFVKGMPEKGKHLFEIVSKNCERLIFLINDILDVEKIESGKMVYNFRDINIGDLIKEAVNEIDQYSKKFKVKVIVNKVVDCIVFADYGRIMQVLINLLSNAIKFSRENTKVIVEMKFCDHSIRVLVKDQGIGIPADFKSKVFGKFLQVDSSATRGVSGTGLGLSICKAIIESHHGTIGFDSSEGKGSTFYFDLPLNKKSKGPDLQRH